MQKRQIALVLNSDEEDGFDDFALDDSDSDEGTYYEEIERDPAEIDPTKSFLVRHNK